MADPIVALYPTDELPQDQSRLRGLYASLSEAVVRRFNDDEWRAKAILKMGCNALVGGTVAKSLGGLTPLSWVLRSFGPMPSQFVTYRATPLIEFIPKGGVRPAYRGVAGFLGGNGARIMIADLTMGQRLAAVARVAGARFILVTIAFEGGYAIGSLINKNLEDDTQFVIGGVLNQIVNEGGWRLAIPKAIRDALGIPGLSEEVDLSTMR